MKKTTGYMIDHITALTSSVWDVLKWRHIIMGFFKEISTQTKKRNSKKRKLNWKTFLTFTISGVIEDLLKLNEKKINFELKIS